MTDDHRPVRGTPWLLRGRRVFRRRHDWQDVSALTPAPLRRISPRVQYWLEIALWTIAFAILAGVIVVVATQ